jgi:hypothetical protein
MGPVMQYADELAPEILDLHIFPGNGTSWLYEDDGHSTAYADGVRRVTTFQVQTDERKLVLERTTQGAFDPGYEGYSILLRSDPGQSQEGTPERRTRGGARGGSLSAEAVTVTVDGVRQAPATVDAEWNALRLAVGRFDRVEACW